MELISIPLFTSQIKQIQRLQDDMSLYIQCRLQATSTFDNQKLWGEIALPWLSNCRACNPALPYREFIRTHIYSTTQDGIPTLFIGRPLVEQFAVLAKLLATPNRHKCGKR